MGSTMGSTMASTPATWRLWEWVTSFHMASTPATVSGHRDEIQVWVKSLAACKVPAEIEELQENPEEKMAQYMSKVRAMAAKGQEKLLKADKRAAVLEVYQKYIQCGGEESLMPPLMKHIRAVLVEDQDAQFHLYSHKMCLEGAVCLYLLRNMAELIGVPVAKAECIMHSDKNSGARFYFAAPDGQNQVRHVIAADIPPAEGDVALKALKSVYIMDHHPGKSRIDSEALCQVCVEGGGIAINACKYNDLTNLATCPCGLSLLVEAFGGYNSALFPPMLTEELCHAIWRTDFFAHPADADLCLVWRLYMTTGPKKLADATPERFAALMEGPEEMATALLAVLDEIPAIVGEVVRKWNKRTLIAASPPSTSKRRRSVMVDVSSETGGLDDLMLYQGLIDTYEEDGVDTLWITKEAQGPTKMRYGLRRAGDYDCGELADGLQKKWSDISSGGHPYASVCVFDVQKEDEIMREIQLRLEVEAHGAADDVVEVEAIPAA
jgi:hypothetical protein